MNSKALNTLIKVMSNPATAGITLTDYRKKRLELVEKSLLVRPIFLGVKNSLPATPASLPISETTRQLKNDVIICGLISNGLNRKAQFYRRRLEPGFFDLNQQGENLTLDAFAGKTIDTGGFNSLYSFPSPLLLRSNETLTLEVFQSESTAATVWSCFNGLHVLNVTNSNAQFSPDEKREVLEQIKNTVTPEPRFSILPVTFTDGQAAATLKITSENVLITGFRSKIAANTLVNFGFSSDRSFSNDLFPLFALAAESDAKQGVYRKLLQPIFLPRNSELYFNFENSVDGGTTTAENGTLEIEMMTP